MMTSSQNFNRESIALVRVSGPRAVQTGVAAFQGLTSSTLEAPLPRILVDMSDVEFIDSAFIGELVSYLKTAAKKGGEVKLFGLQNPVRSLFNTLRLHHVFDIYESESAARSSFSSDSGASKLET